MLKEHITRSNKGQQKVVRGLTTHQFLRERGPPGPRLWAAEVGRPPLEAYAKETKEHYKKLMGGESARQQFSISRFEPPSLLAA